jgi:hypothetical protein
MFILAPGNKKERAVWLALFDLQVFLFYLSLKRHKRRPGLVAVIKIVAKVKAIELVHVERYFIPYYYICQ